VELLAVLPALLLLTLGTAWVVWSAAAWVQAAGAARSAARAAAVGDDAAAAAGAVLPGARVHPAPAGADGTVRLRVGVALPAPGGPLTLHAAGEAASR
jgi:hypothetical protein